MSDEPLVTVQFYDQDVGYENIWALPLDDGTYRLENPPFFIYDISLNDIVAAVPNDEGILQFLTVVKRSGNRTLRARSDKLLVDSGFRSRVEEDIEQMGCVVEEHRERLLAISVPPAAELERITSYLAKMGLNWEYGDPAESNT